MILIGMIIHRIRKFVEVWDHSTFWKPILYQLHNLFLIHLETILHRKKNCDMKPSCTLANVKLFKTPCTHNDITAATHHPFLVTTGAVTPFPHLSNHKVADVGDLDLE